MTETRKLRVFLCHSSTDKPVVRELYRIDKISVSLNKFSLRRRNNNGSNNNAKNYL